MLYFCISINTSFHLKSRKKKKKETEKPLYINNLMIYFIRQITYKVYNIDILSFYHNFFPLCVYMEKFLSLPFSIFHFSKSIEKLKVHIVLWYIIFSRKILYIYLFPYLIIAFSNLIRLRYMVLYFLHCFSHIIWKVIYLAGTDWTMTILLFRSKYAQLIDIFYYYIWFLCVFMFLWLIFFYL